MCCFDCCVGGLFADLVPVFWIVVWVGVCCLVDFMLVMGLLRA